MDGERIEGMAIEAEPSRKAVMLRDDKGHFLPGQSGNPSAIITSSERGKELVTKRESDRALAKAVREAGAAKGLLAGVEQLVDRPITSDADAHAVIAEKLALGAGTAAERGQMREAVAGFGYALKMADQAPADEKQQAMPASGAAILLSGEAAAQFVDMMGRIAKLRNDGE
jgi:hypothetical protein